MFQRLTYLPSQVVLLPEIRLFRDFQWSPIHCCTKWIIVPINFLHREDWKPVWQRADAEGGGVVTGSGASFLVLESREHAEKRGRNAYASMGPVVSRRTRRRSEPHLTARGRAAAPV